MLAPGAPAHLAIWAVDDVVVQVPDERLSAGWRQKHEQLRRQPEVIRAWLDHANYQLKFVVTCGEDVHGLSDPVWLVAASQAAQSSQLGKPAGTAT